MVTTATPANVIHAFYDAALDGSQWPAALRLLQEALAGAGTILYSVDRDRRIPFHVMVDLPEVAMAEYAGHYVKQCPKVAFLESVSGSRHIYDYCFTSESGIGRSEYYDWLQRALGTRYFVGSRLLQDGEAQVFIGVQRTRKAGHVDRRTFALYRRLAMHLERAVRISREAEFLSERAAGFEATFDRAAAGPVVLLDKRGRVMYMNAGAEALLRDSQALRIEDGALRAAMPGDDMALQRAIAQALGELDLEGFEARDAVRITCTPPDPALVARVLPIRVSAPLSRAEAELRALVLIAGNWRSPEECQAQLMDAYGLTPTEAAIAAMLANGQTVDHIARERGIRRSTARLNLERIMAKTGVRRQSELVRLVLTSTACL